MMEQATIFQPFLGMLLLTMAVWTYMYVRRIRWLSANAIDPQKLSTPDKVVQVIPETVNNPANNLKNLFEIPVVFYALCLYLYVAGQVDQVHIICAYAFLIFRAVHSAVQCTFNHVMLRFAVYALSCLAVWVMLVRAVLA